MDMYFTLFVCAVAAGIAIGGALILVGYNDTMPPAFAAGWRWTIPTVLVPVLGPLVFCFYHWADCAKSGKQLLIGIALLGGGVAALYGIGPYFAARAVAQAAGA
jgi:hypothetical protein